MKIDRSRFLLLTASLAAAACDRSDHAASPDTGGADPAHAKDARDGDGDATRTQAGDPSVWLEIEPGTEDAPPSHDLDCDNSAGQPAACSLSAPSSHCESFDSTIRLCESFAGFMQPRAAEAAIDCMLAASGTERICDWQIWNQCTSAGMQATCVDPRTRPECDSVSSMCGGSVDVFTCQQALSAIRPQHQSRVSSCLREFCDPPFCVNDLGQF